MGVFYHYLVQWWNHLLVIHSFILVYSALRSMVSVSFIIYVYLLFFTIFCFVYFIAPTWRYKSGYRSGERFYCVRGWTQVWWRKGNIYILYVLMPVTQVLVCLFNTIPFELIVEPCHAPCTFNYFFWVNFEKTTEGWIVGNIKGPYQTLHPFIIVSQIRLSRFSHPSFISL